jgi:hypothetical protein
MSESQLRLRQVSNNTKLINSKSSISEKSMSSNHVLSNTNNSNNNINSNQLVKSYSNQCLNDEEIDDKVSDNEIDEINTTGSSSKKFSKHERSDLVDLLYSQEVITFSKTNTNQEFSESDAENDQIMTAFNDQKPLLEHKKKRKKVDQFLKSEFRIIGVDSDDDEVVKYDESCLSLSFQVFIPFLIAGFGTVGAGLVLDWVQVFILSFICLFSAQFLS